MNSVFELFLDGWAAVSRLFVLVGLVLALVGIGRFLTRRRSVALAAAGVAPPEDQPATWRHGALPALWWPLVLVWLGFLLGTGMASTLWQLAVGILVTTGLGLAVHAVRVAHLRRGDAEVAPAAMAVLLATAMLLLFGLMLMVRLVVVPDPATDVRGSLSAGSAGEAVRAVLLPAAVLVLAVAALPRLRRLAANGEVRRGLGDRATVSHVRHLVAVVFVAALFAAPLLGGGAHLTIAGVATPEYGKVLYLVTLASVLATYAVQFRMADTPDRHHLWYPIGLFIAVALTSVAKRDMGPLIPLFVATVAMFASVLVAQANMTPEVLGATGRERARARRRVTLRHARPLWAPLAVLLLVGTLSLFLTDYISERGAVWANPWVYTWSPPCAPPPEGVPLPQVPEGTSACQVSYAAAEAGQRSQMSQSLAVIADGGVWGRGLDDTTSGRVPASSTDFVLAVVWSKLGGLAVLLLAALVVALAIGLVRLGSELSRDGPPSERVRAFVVGTAALVSSQFVFVLAATVNALPHSGITAPFLSRGGHSTIALGLGIIAAVVAQYLSASRDERVAVGPGATLHPGLPPARAGAWWARPRVPAALWTFVVCVALVAGITLSPYSGLAEDRPFCPPDTPQVDATRCSTDRIAYDRTSVSVVAGGVAQLTGNRSVPGWQAAPGATLEPADFGGLLQAGAGRGALDDGLAAVLGEASGTSLGQRMGPPSAAERDWVVELTVDPRVQRAATRALATPVPQPDGSVSEPLAGGMVAIDTRTGHVLAAASAPHATGGTPGDVPRDQLARFTAQHPFGVRDGTGAIDESTPCQQSTDEAVLARCWRWSLTAAGGDGQNAADRVFVENDRTVTAPSTNVNRALGQHYGLGSTFKVVIAAAFIRYLGGTADTRIEAPAELTVNRQVVQNAGKGPCPRSGDGGITLRDALAVSCNTAFVRLAQKLGWPRIRDTARDLGFVVGPADETAPAWLARTPAGADSRVPESADGAGIANNALGGGDVVGTPLQLATVLGAVANGGEVVQPTLLDAVTDPRGGTRTAVTGERRRVLDQNQAAQLRDALSATTSPGGTAAALTLPAGRQAWVKTGTHVLYEPDAAPAGVFTHQIAWLVGFVDAPHGPVSFAVAVETRDEHAGAVRARALAEHLIAAVTEEGR